MNKMKKIARNPGNVLVFGVPLLVIIAMVLITKSKAFAANSSALSIAITLDLLFIVPLIYFLLIKNKNIPKTTILPFFVLGIVVASVSIPKEHQSVLNWIKIWLFPIVEIGVVSFIVFKIRKTIKLFKEHAKHTPDFFTVLKETCKETLPHKVGGLLATEIAVFYYGFLYWKTKSLAKNEFTYHKNSGTIALLFGLLLIIGIETYTIHVLLLKWSTIAAWITSGLSIYSGIQIFGFLKSIVKRPITIEDNRLYLRHGILSEVTLDIDAIDTIQITDKDIMFDHKTRKLSPLGELEPHNIVISLKEEHTLIGLYGIKKTFQKIALFIDDKHGFKAILDDKIKDQNII